MSDIGNRNIMAMNISKYLSINKKNQKELCKDLGISESTFSDWINAKSYPRIDKIELMANYFGISKADLIEGDKQPEFYVSDFEKGLITQFRNSDDVSKEMVCRILKYAEYLGKETK